MSAENALLTILLEKIRTDLLVLPTLPEMAIQVRRTADDPNSTIQSLSDVIVQDPALAARLIKIANSAFLGRSVKVTSLNQAITRIGFSQVRNIATAMAMEQLFISQHEQIKGRMSQVWRDSVNVTSVAIACLKYFLEQKRQSHLNLDVMALAGLMHQIGALPILTEAERYQTVFGDPQFLDQALDSLTGSIGAEIMQAWGFAVPFSEIVANWNNPNYATIEPSYIDFIRVAVISRTITSPSQRVSYLEPYLARGVIPDIEFMKLPEIAEVSKEMCEVFN